MKTANQQKNEVVSADTKKPYTFKEFLSKKSLRTTAIVLIVTVCLVLIFFFVYGVARIDHHVKGSEKIYGSVPVANWTDSTLFDITDYNSLTTNENGELTVLMLTDTHLVDGGWYAKGVWTHNDRNRRTYDQINKLVLFSKPDFIYITGDIQTDLMNDITTKKFADYMGSFNIPWTMTFGNHDSETRADKSTLANILLAAENCLFQVGYTNLNGLGNTLIPVYNQQNELVFSFILMDFGDWQARHDANKLYSTEDVGATANQIAWYEWTIKGLETSATKKIETMLLSHIPMHAFTHAVKLATYQKEQSGATFLYHDDPFETESEFGWSDVRFDDYRTRYHADGYRGENTFTLDYYNEYKQKDAFYNKIFTLGSTMQIATGHNHCDGYSVLFDGITFTSVVKTGDIYTNAAWDNNFRGGTVFKLNLKGAGNNIITSSPVNAKVL